MTWVFASSRMGKLLDQALWLLIGSIVVAALLISGASPVGDAKEERVFYRSSKYYRFFLTLTFVLLVAMTLGQVLQPMHLIGLAFASFLTATCLHVVKKHRW